MPLAAPVMMATRPAIERERLGLGMAGFSLVGSRKANPPGSARHPVANYSKVGAEFSANTNSRTFGANRSFFA
jgi:hypothetical protein